MPGIHLYLSAYCALVVEGKYISNCCAVTFLYLIGVRPVSVVGNCFYFSSTLQKETNISKSCCFFNPYYFLIPYYSCMKFRYTLLHCTFSNVFFGAFSHSTFLVSSLYRYIFTLVWQIFSWLETLLIVVNYFLKRIWKINIFGFFS
jgi:hypothetical protein